MSDTANSERELRECLEGCDFAMVAGQFRDALKFAKEDAAKESKEAYLHKPFYEVLQPFIQNPCLPTALSLLKLAPFLLQYFKEWSPGGELHWMQQLFSEIREMDSRITREVLLRPGHPAIGSQCAICQKPFRVSDASCLIGTSSGGTLVHGGCAQNAGYHSTESAFVEGAQSSKVRPAVSMPRLVRFDGLVIKPLWLLYLAVIGWCIYAREWLFVLGSLFAWFLIGLIGTSCHSNETSAELRKGLPPNWLSEGVGTECSHEESLAIAKRVLPTGIVVSASIFLWAVHNGIRWYWSVALFLLSCWVLSGLFLFITATPELIVAAKRRRTSKTSAKAGNGFGK
jgi:hypothetical protein